MKNFFIIILVIFGVFLSNRTVYADCKININGLSVSGTKEVGSQVSFTVDATSSCDTALYYRFSVHSDYGTSGYDGLNWQSMTHTEWVTTDAINYSFDIAGKYIVVVWATHDISTVDSDSIPIYGCSVDVTDDSGKTDITGFDISGTLTTYNPVTFTVNSASNPSKTLYYRFSIHPDYGSSGYDGLHWQRMTSSEWILENSIDYTFTENGRYIVVVWISTDSTHPDSNGIPIIGGSVDIELNPNKNHKPVVSPISLNVDSSVPYYRQQLIGQDPDGDTITYELVSSSSGVGYSLAYVNSETGMLYITNEPSGNDSFTLSYRATDSQLFSDPEMVTIKVTYLSEDEYTAGRNEIDPLAYSQFETSTYSSDLLGNESTNASQPLSVDLSSNFPEPGSQGNQNSCVGWAVAYALKSYQEKIEIGWSLNAFNHLFSPAYIYNQINRGRDQGSYISEALDLVIHQGAATLSTMPYSDANYLSQPSSQAITEASQYKAVKRIRINDTSQIKAALVNRRPVVAGIQIYKSFYNIKGENSVYNTATGNNLGGHAVTIVGYNDNKFGGAFKIINSWGQSWGDGGYFWLPYEFVPQIGLSESYVLEDGENGSTHIPEDPSEPTPEFFTLPNLTVNSWEITYDPRPDGSGKLTYIVANTGTGVALAGADVSLVLSKNAVITTNDYYVVYEDIPFDLQPGSTVYRNASNSISFRFPDQLEAGIYYMALWVDDLNEVIESNENDNISKAGDTITIENTLPDLSVNSWYADWDGSGNGSLIYEVSNNGASTTRTTSWDINLILDPDQTLGNGNEIYLFYETAGYYLEPGHMIYRNSASAASFNLYRDYSGNIVPSGVYYLALWVDDLNKENESNEYNNGSYSWSTVNISTYQARPDKAESKMIYLGKDIINSSSKSSWKAYNGRKLPSKNIALQKVEVRRTAGGIMTMNVLDTNIMAGTVPKTKKISSKAKLIFPSTVEIPMPDGE